MTPRETVLQSIDDGIEKISAVFDPLIYAVEIKIGKLENAGLDASNYYDLEDDSFTNFYEVRDLYLENKNSTISEFQEKMDVELERIIDLENQAVEPPEEEELPVEQILFILIKSALENGVKIKVEGIEWDSKKPLGGKGSVFDDLRNEAFRSIGVDPESDIADILRDPVNSAAKLAENVDNETKKALTDAKETADKAATDVKKAVDKAATQAKETIDKAATDAKKAADKAATDARKTAEKAARDVAKVISKLPKVKIPKGPKIGGGFKW